VQDELVCIFEVEFLTGNSRCLDIEYYKTEIEPYEVIMPSETFQYFKELALKACALAGKKKKSGCSHDVKTIDDHVKTLYDLTKKYGKTLP